jgi:hypothetical protein
MVRKIFLVIVCLFNVNLFAQFDIKVKTDTTDYLIGDYIHFELQAKYPKDFILNEPIYKDSLKKFEVIEESISKFDTTENSIEFYKKIILAYYDSSEIYIPSLHFLLTSNKDTTKFSFYSDSLLIKVHSLEIKTESDIKDIKEPIKIPLDILKIILWTLLALLVLAIIFFLIKKFIRKERKQIIEPQIILPPHVLALTKLDELEREKLWQNGKVKEYHSRITEIVREYFERRFYFPALELTSSEQIQYLKNYDEAKNIINITESFFNNADLVKFAKFNPVPDLNGIMMIQAKEIINLTIPKDESSKIEKNAESVNV